jgi:hypothetical protein
LRDSLEVTKASLDVFNLPSEAFLLLEESRIG